MRRFTLRHDDTALEDIEITYLLARLNARHGTPKQVRLKNAEYVYDPLKSAASAPSSGDVFHFDFLAPLRQCVNLL
jgi:hypothetical protein